MYNGKQGVQLLKYRGHRANLDKPNTIQWAK